MSAYKLPNGTLLIFLNNDPFARFPPCGICGSCCDQVETGQCSGGYEGICHLEWEQAGVDLDAYRDREAVPAAAGPGDDDGGA